MIVFRFYSEVRPQPLQISVFAHTASDLAIEINTHTDKQTHESQIEIS